MAYTLTKNSSLKIEGFFKNIIEKLFFTTVFITGAICTSYALDCLFSIYPSLPHELLKVMSTVMAEAEKEMIQMNTDQRNRMLNYQNEDSLIQDRCATILKKRKQAT